MLRYLYGQNDLVAGFVARMIPHLPPQRDFRNCVTIGVCRDNELIAGIVYHRWNPAAGVIEITGAALPGCRWLTRETIRVMYDYPFAQCGCQMVVKMVPAKNRRLLRQLKAGGHKQIPVSRIYGRDRDGVLCLFTREAWENCKFIRRQPERLQEVA